MINSIRISVPSICTGYGTARPARVKRTSDSHSARAHIPAATDLPNDVLLAIARASRPPFLGSLRPSV